MKWIYRFFVVLGVIFFLLLIGLAYFVIADPLNLRPLVTAMYQIDSTATDMATTSIEVTNSENADVSETIQQPTRINETQAQALESVGINPTSVPTQFTPEQTECFVRILGQERVDAIVAGATPTPVEFYQAKECL